MQSRDKRIPVTWWPVNLACQWEPVSIRILVSKKRQRVTKHKFLAYTNTCIYVSKAIYTNSNWMPLILERSSKNAFPHLFTEPRKFLGQLQSSSFSPQKPKDPLFCFLGIFMVKHCQGNKTQMHLLILVTFYLALISLQFRKFLRYFSKTMVISTLVSEPSAEEIWKKSKSWRGVPITEDLRTLIAS